MRIIHLTCAVLFAACAGARPSFAQTEAERVVQAHHDAYNRRDAVALVAMYAPDAVVIGYPADTVLHGAGSLRQMYKQQFRLMPRVRVEVRGRTTQGNMVVDELLYRGFPCGGTLSERVTYEVEDGRIRAETSVVLSSDVPGMQFAGGAPVCFPAPARAREP
jgi:hypothetical protein